MDDKQVLPEFPIPTPPPGDPCETHVTFKEATRGLIVDKERPIIGIPGPGRSRPAVLPDPDTK